jgi:hypothetical protein
MSVAVDQERVRGVVPDDRLRRAEELDTERGPGWREESRPGTFGCHELLDRTSLAMRALDDWVLSHPACVANEEWFALAERASELLNELYQRVGGSHLDAEGEPPAGPAR